MFSSRKSWTLSIAVALLGCAAADPTEEHQDEQTGQQTQSLEDWAHARDVLTAKYNSLPSEVLDALGNSLGGVHACDSYAFQNLECAYLEFEGGRIYMNDHYSQDGPANVMYGEIYQTWLASGQPFGREYYTGTPITDETSTPDGRGRYNHFSVSSIYWTPDYGAHVVSSWIRGGWERSGWEQGPWGYPIGNQLENPQKNGRCGPNPSPSYPLVTQDFEWGFACANYDRVWLVPY